MSCVLKRASTEITSCMNKRIALQHIGCFFLLSGLLTACQKEIDWGLGGGGNQLLVRIVAKSGASDSTVTTYTYNGQRKLIKETTVSVTGGNSVQTELILNRNSAGVITSAVQKSPDLAATGLDSIVTRFNYSNNRYTSGVFSLNLMGLSFTDSTLYTYDGNGRIISDQHLLKSSLFPLPIPIPILKNVYTYSADGKNLVKQEQSAPNTPGGPLSPVSSQTYTFDTKVNPLILLSEAIILNRPDWFHANNVLTNQFASSQDPTLNFTLDNTYRYNASNKPDSLFSSRAGQVTTSKFYYQ
jgi:YD repeat-containing protein